MTVDDELVNAVLTAVADQEGVDVSELRKPLYDVIDPDALEGLFKHDTGLATFEYYGYTVTVDHRGNVEVNGTSDT